MFQALGTETHVFIQTGILLPFDTRLQKAERKEYERIGIRFYDESKQNNVEDLGYGWKRMYYQLGKDEESFRCL